jgi:hypothetical protein
MITLCISIMGQISSELQTWPTRTLCGHNVLTLFILVLQNWIKIGICLSRSVIRHGFRADWTRGRMRVGVNRVPESVQLARAMVNDQPVRVPLRTAWILFSSHYQCLHVPVIEKYCLLYVHRPIDGDHVGYVRRRWGRGWALNESGGRARPIPKNTNVKKFQFVIPKRQSDQIQDG